MPSVKERFALDSIGFFIWTYMLGQFLSFSFVVQGHTQIVRYLHVIVSRALRISSENPHAFI